MFKGNGEPQLGAYLDMPDNSAVRARARAKERGRHMYIPVEKLCVCERGRVSV